MAKIKVSTLEAQLRELEAQKRQAQDAIATAEAQVSMRISEKAAAEALVQQRANRADRRTKSLGTD